MKREVALKILPASFATDPDRLARFQREAEVLASLNHPHIAVIYKLEEVMTFGRSSWSWSKGVAISGTGTLAYLAGPRLPTTALEAISPSSAHRMSSSHSTCRQ